MPENNLRNGRNSCTPTTSRTPLNRKSINRPFQPVLTDQTNIVKSQSRRTWHGKTQTKNTISELDAFEALSLPDSVVQVYKKARKVKKLYDWQNECLKDKRLLNGSNFILSLPTGAGKTLIAELLMLRCTLASQKSCVLILPFVAIVNEKVVSLGVFEDDLNICIEEYAGQRGKIPPLKRPERSIYVCTIEKANMLFSSLISENRMNEIGLVIVDEMHLLSDERRGFVLEQCLTKSLLTNSSAQIIGLSATLSSIDKLKKFLNAELFTTNFRPVELIENIKIGDDIYCYDESEDTYKLTKKVKRLLPKQQDPDNLIPLIDEVIPDKSVMVFCQSKQAAENLCQRLAQLMPTRIRAHRKEQKETIIKQIKDSNDGGVICQKLQAGIYAGVAYHHSGLTRDERQFVEESFRQSTICVICSTSTLATGINLPARRVIIRTTKIGMNMLSKTQYLQMVGRAGRAGLDSEGDSFVFVDNEKYVCFLFLISLQRFITFQFKGMRQSKLPEIVSGMNSIELLESFLLDLLALKICKNKAELQDALKSTLYNDTDENQSAFMEEAVKSLISKKMLNENMEISELGIASSKANLPPVQAVSLYNSLVQTLEQGLVLSSRFHLLWIIVPYDLDLNYCNYNLFYDEYQKLSKGEREMLVRNGVTTEKIINSMSMTSNLKSGSVFQRTYIAFMLKHLWTVEANTSAVAQKFDVTRGWLNSMLQSVCAHANQILRFCADISKFFAYRQLFPDLIQQLRITTQKELTQFLELDCIKLSRAQCLYNSGYRTIGDVAKSTPADLIKSIHLLNVVQAERIISSAKVAAFWNLFKEQY
ncbi:hypothetical protein M3Y97_00075000 [Aphelenchoides bicaudatus]|nr:hypothetical protein M3Y97_00075000 [Aphelenchoides bicaudatus]